MKKPQYTVVEIFRSTTESEIQHFVQTTVERHIRNRFGNPTINHASTLENTASMV